jgi:hypothetical protein
MVTFDGGLPAGLNFGMRSYYKLPFAHHKTCQFSENWLVLPFQVVLIEDFYFGVDESGLGGWVSLSVTKVLPPA